MICKIKIRNVIFCYFTFQEKCKLYITLENIDEAIEKAIDNPSNINFTLSVDGTINWEGKPSLEYEANINQRVAKGKMTQHVMK